MLNVPQIQAALKGMSQQQLFQAGQDNANDALMFSLINNENQNRQKMRAAAMAPQAGQQQPPVVAQDLAQMAPTPAPNMPTGVPLQGPGSAAQMQEMPENTGIGALPAQNLTKMADGGITGYADGGAPDYTPDVYKRYAMQQAQKIGIDPRFADSIFQIESGYKPTAQSPTGPVGIGQLTSATAKAYGLDPSQRSDGFKNIDASLSYLKDLSGKYGSDPGKVAIAYNQGEGYLNNHLKANNGQINYDALKPEPKGYLDKLTNMFISPAQAEQVPGITPNTPQPSNAPTYTPEGVEAIGQRLDQARADLRNMRGQGIVQRQKDPNAAVNYQNAQDLVSNLQRTYEEGMASAHPDLTKAAMIGNPANPQGSLRVLPATTPYVQQVAQQTAAPDIARQNAITPTAPASNVAGPGEPGWGMDLGQEPVSTDPLKGTPTAPSTSDIANTVTSGSKGGRDWNDFLLNLGLGLMAGKSPYALQNLGEAGIGALRQEQEQKKMDLEQRKQDALEALQKQQGQYYGAYAEAIKRGAKEKNTQLAVDEMINKELAANKMLGIDPAAREAERRKLQGIYYPQYGINSTMPQVDTSGFKFVGSRPGP
jgi:soluble lytic murein transglycosylase-like protein